ncbi:unnamed protein product [Hydatigera taeniaeformis]|uniref:guanylate cyclase n=1 Tax=Hydatigena taeniaeformis TaxID=6205 RepID=A0A0R3WLB1_HYDTA|nr:unnamed protein product [Hydatigera taeniaeformis]
MLPIAFLAILITTDYLAAATEIVSSTQRHLTIYTLTPDLVCSPEMMLYNFTHSVTATVRYANTLLSVKNAVCFLGTSRSRWVPGCSMQEGSRAGIICKLLQNLQQAALNSTGFSAFLGPPLDSDCNSVREWIRLGYQEGSQRVQLYQISYHCRIFDSFAWFVNHFTDSRCDSLGPPISAVSVVVQRKLILQGIIVYLLSMGWKRVALLYDISITNLDIPGTWDSIPLNIRLSRKRQNVPQLLTSVPIKLAANFLSSFQPLEDHIDVALILARPAMAMEFLASIQNLSRVKQGRIALIQVNPKDILTYDALREWRWRLPKIGPTLAAGRSLIILTALPKGTAYDENSIIFKERINLQVASGAALAMRLVQIHLQEGDGHLNSSANLFEPLRTNPLVRVPALPNVTFQYRFGDDNVIQGSFDFLLFALKANVTDAADTKLPITNYNDIFDLVHVIHFPPILPQPRRKMSWPGDGTGPHRTQCLIAPCDIVLNHRGFQFRQIVNRKKRFIPLKLIFLESDFVYDGRGGGLADDGCKGVRVFCRPMQRWNEFGSIFLCPPLYWRCSPPKEHSFMGNWYRLRVESLHAIHLRQLPMSTSRRRVLGEEGVQVRMKRLLLSHVVLRAQLIEHLAGLREIRHENVNAFLGCCVTSEAFNLVFEHCHWGCLQDVIARKSIVFDRQLKLSFMTDLARGMEYLHSTRLKAHGRLKSTNCVVSWRWTLKVTDFGIPEIYHLNGDRPSIGPEEQLWTSPELLRDVEAAPFGTKPGDVYAFAIIMHEVFCQTSPYGPDYFSASEILERVMAQECPPFRPQLPKTGIPSAVTGILQRAWSENPTLRPTFKKLNGEIQQMTRGHKTNIVEHVLKLMENYSSCLEEQVTARVEELSTEQRRKDLLIRRMLPPVVAEALKSGIAVVPEIFDEVSIYISDIVGFTTISAMSTPIQVVDMLNDLYTRFDETIANYDVYKVETIGDAYMVASGLPVRNGRRHASEIATMALDLLSVCGAFTIKHLPEVPLTLRIGLHSGPCVAGVVGFAMPRYCLFGATVNQALKMESSGAAFRIHISATMKDILDQIGGYHFAYRGSIEFEGGVKTTSYWLSGSDNFRKPLPKPPPLPT